ncbi:MAG: oligosaccharide repeat unit polymerase [Flaviramulus sp.]|nr:oligosaccharide repeat unit polymerase [Flaviramulus sp.]
MILYFIFIALTTVIAYINNSVSKKLFYPATYVSFLWVLFVTIHLLYLLFSDRKPFPLSFIVLSYFFLALLLFSLGGLIAKGLHKNNLKADVKTVFSTTFLNVILIVNIFSLIFYFIKIKELTGYYFNLLLFRYYTSVEGIDIGFIKYSLTFSIFSLLLVLIDFYNKERKTYFTSFRLFLIFLLSFTISFLSASKGAFLFLLISTLGVYSVYRRINIKLVLKTVGITLAVFLIMGNLLKKSIPNEHTSKIEYTVFDKVEYLLYSYATLPLSAFDKFLNEPYKITYGDIAFRFPKAVFYKIGLTDTPPKDLVEKYVKVPDLVNVYTAYYKLIKDFGIIYSLTAMFLFGYLHTYFFIHSKKSFGSLIGFSMLLFPLTMTFFEENYTSLLSTWIQVILFVYATKFFMKYKYD